MVMAKAQFVACHADDTRTAGAHHLDRRPLAQANLRKAMDLLRITDDFAHFAPLAGRQATQRYQQFVHSNTLGELGRCVK